MFLFVLMQATYFSVLFNPKWALPPWASGGVKTRAPGPGEPLGHCQVPGASGWVPQERWASSKACEPAPPGIDGAIVGLQVTLESFVPPVRKVPGGGCTWGLPSPQVPSP